MDKFKEAEEARERIYILREEASQKALSQAIECKFNAEPPPPKSAKEATKLDAVQPVPMEPRETPEQ